jgi:hypothetical protein
MNDWSFRAGSSRLKPPENLDEVAQLVRLADPDYWNGATGVSCFSRDAGDRKVHLYASVSDDGRWHLRYQFADDSYVIAHNLASAIEPRVAIWMGGNQNAIPANQFVDGGIAYEVMRQFITDGRPSDAADWVVPIGD